MGIGIWELIRCWCSCGHGLAAAGVSGCWFASLASLLAGAQFVPRRSDWPNCNSQESRADHRCRVREAADGDCFHI